MEPLTYRRFREALDEVYNNTLLPQPIYLVYMDELYTDPHKLMTKIRDDTNATS